jgi:glycosyltransferase involved in cell wall biosynthesis
VTFFSFLLCIYNEDDYLLVRCFESILNQTFKNYEIVVIVDNPNFVISKKTKSLLNKFHRKQIIFNPVNYGLTKSLNIGLNRTKGKFIVRQDADDYSHNKRLERAYKILNKNHKVYTSCSKIDGKIFPRFWFRLFYSNKIIRFRNIFFHGALIIDRDILLKYSYNEDFKYSQDFELYNRLLDNGVIIFFDKNSISYFQNHSNNNITSTYPLRQKYFYRMILKKNSFLWKENRYLKLFKIDYFITLYFYIKNNIKF